ncbi:MAG: hypothetical protein HY541_00035, partial [Deltaproteobacteria bacterium]|nr:hypothetical protein [Deltaproteobacteria bacterium]
IKLSPKDILTVRERGEAPDLGYIDPSIKKPQYPDKSINQSGFPGEEAKNMAVLVDFTDPRLTEFLDTAIGPIKKRLKAGEINKKTAAISAWEAVSKQVAYVDYRQYESYPARLFNLGEFTENGVCNERGMLLQVSLQYLGIESRMEKGPFRGRQRHAWVRTADSAFEEMILDPQQDGVIYPEPESDWNKIYRDDGTPFAVERVETIGVSGDELISQLEESVSFEIPSGKPAEEPVFFWQPEVLEGPLPVPFPDTPPFAPASAVPVPSRGQPVSLGAQAVDAMANVLSDFADWVLDRRENGDVNDGPRPLDRGVSEVPLPPVDPPPFPDGGVQTFTLPLKEGGGYKPLRLVYDTDGRTFSVEPGQDVQINANLHFGMTLREAISVHLDEINVKGYRFASFPAGDLVEWQWDGNPPQASH